MVAGGGASVVYADTISDYGFGKVSFFRSVVNGEDLMLTCF